MNEKMEHVDSAHAGGSFVQLDPGSAQAGPAVEHAGAAHDQGSPAPAPAATTAKATPAASTRASSSRTRLIVGAVAAIVTLAILGAVAWGTSAARDPASTLLKTTHTTETASDDAASSGSQASSTTAAASSASSHADMDSSAEPSSSQKASSSQSSSQTSSTHNDASSSQEEVVITETIIEETAADDNAQPGAYGQEGSAAQGGQASQGGAPVPDPAPAPEADPAPAPAESTLVDVVVVFDSSNAHAHNASYPSSLGEYTVQIQPGQTVYDALVATGIQHTKSGASYISSIGGLAERACSSGSGWLYLVDGQLPMQPSTSYQLQGGEVVRWAYTVDEGDV